MSPARTSGNDTGLAELVAGIKANLHRMHDAIDAIDAIAAEADALHPMARDIAENEDGGR